MKKRCNSVLVANRYKRIDIICSLILNGVSSVEIMIRCRKIKPDVMKLLWDELNSGDDLSELKHYGNYKAYWKALSRVIKETDGKPYGYKCDIEYLINHKLVSFVFREAKINPMVEFMLRSANAKGVYLTHKTYKKLSGCMNMGRVCTNFAVAVEGAMNTSREIVSIAARASGKVMESVRNMSLFYDEKVAKQIRESGSKWRTVLSEIPCDVIDEKGE